MKRALSFMVFATLMSPTHGEPLQVCASPWAPYSFQDGTEIKGIHTDLVRKTLEFLNLPHEFKILPWTRALSALQEGSCDLLFSASRLPERESYAFYVEEPLEVLSTDLISTKKVMSSFSPTEEHPYPEPIGSPHGYSVTKRLQEDGYKVDASAIDNTQDFKKLALGRVKSTLMGRQAYNLLLRGLTPAHQGHFVVIKYDVYPPISYFILVSKHSEESPEKAKQLALTLSKALETIKTSR